MTPLFRGVTNCAAGSKETFERSLPEALVFASSIEFKMTFRLNTERYSASSAGEFSILSRPLSKAASAPENFG